jgi:hypothetical protein
VSIACFVAVACGGADREVPVSPTAPGGGAPAPIAAPTAASPPDDAQIGTLRPTLTINNVTGAGTRTYEFQIADNAGFAIAPGRIATFVVAHTQSGVPEGSGGQTSLTVPTDLLPTTRYYWRARAAQGTSVGAWSATSRFRTRVESFKSGNTVYDHILDGRTVADLQRNVVFIDDQSPGMKLDDSDAYLGYRISALPEGEFSFVAVRIKPTGDRTFIGQSKMLTMQDGTSGTLAANAHRALVDRFWDTGRVRFEFRSSNSGGSADSAGQSWQDHFPYLVKLEWRGGTARLRVFNGDSEGAGTKVDLTTQYTAPYNPGSHTVVIGSLHNDSMRDMRVSRVYIGPGARPASLGSVVIPE